MKILAIPGSYPHPGHIASAAFMERSVVAMQRFCEQVVVLSPRPWIPRFLAACHSRWRAYQAIPAHERRNGIEVYHPARLQLPKIASTFWADRGAYYCCRGAAQRLHRIHRFDAIISMDLSQAGGLAWRLGRALGIPAAGWACGSDVRTAPYTAADRALWRAISHLDCVLYQSRELLECARQCAARYNGCLPAERHVVQPRGISLPPPRPSNEELADFRRRHRIPDDVFLVLSLGRILRSKGIRETLQAFSMAASQNERLYLVIVGEKPGFDDGPQVRAMIADDPRLANRVSILPLCPPQEVWSFYYLADLFVFTSHREGCPNALLEAMAVGLPSVAFAIPAVQEVDRGEGGVALVEPFDCEAFARTVQELAISSERRQLLGSCGKKAIAERFSIDCNMAAVLEIMKTIIGRK